jgi:predicted HTH domain antitoxin
MQLTIDLPDNLTQTDSFTQTDWMREIAILLWRGYANALFQLERITISRASKIAGIDLMEFQKLISDRGICVHYDVEEFEQDVQHLRDRAWL